MSWGLHILVIILKKKVIFLIFKKKIIKLILFFLFNYCEIDFIPLKKATNKIVINSFKIFKYFTKGTNIIIF